MINFDNRTEVHEMMQFVEDELQSAKVTGAKVTATWSRDISHCQFWAEEMSIW